MRDTQTPSHREPGTKDKDRPRQPAMEPGKPETWPKEIGGQAGPEPTRYGDWEKGGRCTDF
ncbi:MAG: DUF1674 domain-containing protein [Ectothiorhodospiraceae bacterium]|nr:DUF1674 domain-containing protein [Ectothiorhodospiraceae bacterium]